MGRLKNFDDFDECGSSNKQGLNKTVIQFDT